MIKAINTANKNNNIQNKVNFKGKGNWVDVKPHELSWGLIARLGMNNGNDNAIIARNKLDDAHLFGFFGIIGNHVGATIDELRSHWAGLDFEQVQRQYNDLHEMCTAKKRCDRDRAPATLVSQKTWKDGLRGKIGDFEAELREFLIKTLGIVSKKGNFRGIPLNSVTIVDGSRKVPDDYRRIANNVTIKGGQLDTPRFRNVFVNEVDNPQLIIADAEEANVLDSNIGKLSGRRLTISDSTIEGKVTAGESLDIVGESETGEIKTGGLFSCQEGSLVTINGDAVFPSLIVHPNSKVYVNGAIINPFEKPTIHVRDGASLAAKEIYAKTLVCPKSAEVSATGRMSIENAPLRVRIEHYAESALAKISDLTASSVEVEKVLEKTE